MRKDQAFDIVYQERNYQDSFVPAGEVLPSGQTRAERDKGLTPHLVLLQVYTQKAMEAWTVKGNDIQALKQVAKIAAIAVRALEKVGNSDVLLTEGLR